MDCYGANVELHEDCIRYRNAEASQDLILGVSMDAECDKEYVKDHLEKNLTIDVPWLIEAEKNCIHAVVCGAAPSIHEHIDEIAEKQRNGAVVFACNSSAKTLVERGVVPDWQVVIDPNPLTLDEFEPICKGHLLASIAQPELFNRSRNAVLWHPCTQTVVDRVDGMSREFTYIGGGVTVSNSALCIAYTLGHRSIDVYGMDSSYGDSYYADGRSLDDIKSQQLRVVVDACGKKYSTTFDLKQQVVVFLKLADALMSAGVFLRVHGSGLLPDVWRERIPHP